MKRGRNTGDYCAFSVACNLPFSEFEPKLMHIHYITRATMNVLHRYQIRWTSLLIGLLLPIVCLAEIPSVGELKYWNDPSGVAVAGDRVFVSSWNKGLGMFDLSNPAEPIEMTVLPWDSIEIEGGFAVAGNLLYAGTVAGEFRIYNIAVPTHPVLLGQTTIQAGVDKICVRDSLAAVLNFSGNIVLVNVGNAADPVVIQYILDVDGMLGFMNNYLCTICGTLGLMIWDVSNPSAPVVTSSVAPTIPENFGGGLLVGQVAFCSRFSGEVPLGLCIIDLSDPLLPEVRGLINDYDILYEGWTASDSTLYLSMSPNGGIAAWNIGDLDTPILTETYSPSRHFGRLFTCAGRLGVETYLAPRIMGLYDVSEPDTLQPLSAFGTRAEFSTLKAQDQYLFGGDLWGGLHVLDLQNPEAPTEVAFSDSIATGSDIVLAGDYAYLAGSVNGLQIVNIADPVHPVLESRLALAGNAMSVVVSGNYVYVLCYIGPNQYRVYALSAAIPAAPAVTDSCTIESNQCKMALYNSHLYISGTQGHIASLTDPAHPVLSVSDVVALHGQSISTSGALAFVSRGVDGWSIVSLANPSVPAVVYSSGSITGRYLRGFVGLGSHLFVTSQLADIWRYQIQVYDISNPAYPTLVGETALTDEPIGPILPMGTYLYAAGFSSLKIYDCAGVFPPSPVTPQPTPVPTALSLAGCYPNPFNPSTTVVYDLPALSRVRVAIYDVIGREVAVLADGAQTAGHYELRFDGASLPTGTYFCRLTSGGQSQIKKLLLLK
jgi:hypothetical protein